MLNSVILLAAVFIIGTLFGSFINAAEYRLFRGISLVRDGKKPARSQCPSCHAVLRARDLIPVMSFLLLRGRCHSCGKKIAWQYPVVECAAGLIVLAAFVRFGWTLDAAMVSFFGLYLLFFFIYDLKHQLIPDAVILPLILISVMFSYLRGIPLSSLGLGALIAGGFFLLQYLASKGKWIGAGDIRLGVLMGVMLGWQLTVVALFLAYVGGAFIALCLLTQKKARMETKLPLGTFLSAATVVTLLYGQQIIDWYLHLLL